MLIPIYTIVSVGKLNHFMTDEERKIFIDFARIDCLRILYNSESLNLEKYDKVFNEKCKLLLHGFNYNSAMIFKTDDLSKHIQDFV